MPSQKDLLNYYQKKNFKNKCRLHLSEVDLWLKSILALLFPEKGYVKIKNFPQFLRHMKSSEKKLTKILCQLHCNHEGIKNIINLKKAQKISHNFFEYFLTLEKTLQADAESILTGDPAAESIDEIYFCYPGLQAISYYRIAHFFYQQNIVLLPRSITEIAHQQTGVDIHPGAKIGQSFFIDHGTGIVIGETALIGNHVKIYQGVTLGALSVEKELQNKKRHPTIEDDCILYANATILGGQTIIGKNSIIGGNVWITESVPKNSKIFYR